MWQQQAFNWKPSRQPTREHVELCAAAHRIALELLKKIAGCCLTESTSWVANIQALIKAKQDEEKALEREKAKENKKAAAAAKRSEEKAARAAAAEAKKKAKAAKSAEDEGADADAAEPTVLEAPKKSKRNRNRVGQQELEETDPDLFKTMFKFSIGAMATLEDVPKFLQQIAEAPQAACLARLQRGTFKKVLSDSLKFA